jgi:hypothetical protein
MRYPTQTATLSKKLDDEDLITEQEFADRTGFSIQAIRDFRRNGEIEFYRFPTRNGLPDGAIRYEIADLKKFKAKYKFLGLKPLIEDSDNDEKEVTKN